jgi:preprotein translocase subunit SecE
MSNSTDKENKISFFTGIKAEFKKISWPDRQSIVKQSIAVVLISIAMGLLIAVLDFIIQNGVNLLTSI